MRQIVRQRNCIKYGSFDFRDEKLSEVLTTVKNMIAEFGESAVIEIEHEEDYGSHTVGMYVITERYETDEEKSTREKHAKYQEDARRRQYEALKKEFGE